MIQLLTEDKIVLYELQKSEMFPDYCSVLKEAIAYAIDLNGLRVDFEEIDGLVWRGVNFESVSFHNCSMKRNVFLECTGNLLCYSCNLEQFKIKHSHFGDICLTDCKLPNTSFKDSSSVSSFICNCNLLNVSFRNSFFENITFHSCNLINALFCECILETSRFLHEEEGVEWYKDMSFIKSQFISCDLSGIHDLSQLYFWESNVSEMNFATLQQFSIIENQRSKVIYAIDSDVIWWKTFRSNEILPYRQSTKEFLLEVGNRFPTTDVFPEMDELDVEEELLAVCAYIRCWERGPLL